MKTIPCRSIYGNMVEVPADKMVFRIGVYALICRGEKALLVTNRSTGKFAFPGGGVDLGEKMEDALRRELREEAGMEIEILRFLSFRENFFYYDPKDEAFHGMQFYYLCRSAGVIPEGFSALDDEAEKPCWVAWQDCAEEDFQSREEYSLLCSIGREEMEKKAGKLDD